MATVPTVERQAWAAPRDRVAAVPAAERSVARRQTITREQRELDQADRALAARVRRHRQAMPMRVRTVPIWTAHMARVAVAVAVPVTAQVPIRLQAAPTAVGTAAAAALAEP
jgi:hypothetical protein